MSTAANEFGQVLHKWKDANTMPWGRLRYTTSRMNIARHTDERILRILDVGGGDGMDAIHYAKLGHSVTLTDCSPTMLSEAKKSAEEQGIGEQLKICQTEPDAVPGLLCEQPFDLILCHMMIEFVQDAQVLLSEMCKLLVPGGLLSLLDTNRYSDVYLKAFQMSSLSDALEAVDAKEYFHPWVNRLTPRFSADEFIDQLDGNGCTLVGHYGVLNLCAYLPNEPKFDPQYFSELEELECRLTDRYPYYLLARFFQVIAKKA
jgi:S-adenosylmethionine-dependent methyltransferase